MTQLLPVDSLEWTPQDSDFFFDIAKRADYLAVDTESSGADIRDGSGYCQGVSVSFSFPGSTPALSCYLPFRHPGDNLDKRHLAQLKELLENAPKLIFHNAKFDLVSLSTLGINYTGPFYDTMLMAHWLNENLLSKSLDYCSKLYCGNEGKKKSVAFQAILSAFGWAGVPAKFVAEYAANDAEITLALFEYLYPKFKEEEFDGELWDIEQEFVRLIIRMESRGVRIDQALAERLGGTGRLIMDDLADMIGVNPGSPKQLGELLINQMELPVLKVTPGGKASFDKEAMKQYEEILSRSNDNRAKWILEYRGWQKAVTSNYEPYVRLASTDGRLRPNYKLHGTVTGRLSCEKPNLQQIPRSGSNAWNGSMKQCFIPADGYTLWEADYSQLELRLGAAYAQETKLLEIFADDSRDVFTEMAAQVNMDRFSTKTLTYTIQYGGGATRISHVFGVSADQATRIKDNYYQTYPGFKVVQQLAASKCRSQKFLRLWTNRRRHFQYPSDEAHKAFNSAIQGGAAEIVKRTMLRLGEEVDSDDDCKMLLQIHDSVVFEIKNGLEHRYLTRIKETMESVTPDFGVKFKVDVHKWGES